MKMAAEIQEDLHQAYPGIEFRVVKKYTCFHSTIYRLTTRVADPEFPHEVILKKYRDNNTFDARCEYFHLDSFYTKNTDTVVSSPLPIMIDPDKQFILIGFIPGQTVKNYLLKFFPERISHINDYIDLSARALARFHSVFIKNEDREITINSPLLTTFGEDELEHYTGQVPDCGIKTKAQAYIDFSPQNLIIHDGRIFLIDFPDRECICTPHLDIARWKFNLLFLKQFPQFRFLNLDWWDEDLVFQRFLKKYCSEMHCTSNEQDIHLTDYFLYHYAKTLKSIYTRSDALSLKIEYRYLSGFLHSLTDR
jgi:hypothetical protein